MAFTTIACNGGKMQNEMFTVGADPEIFVGKGNEFVCAHGLIPGDKKNPFKVDKGAVQVDGMALEFNIDPAKNEQEFLDNLNRVQEQLKAMVPDMEFLNAASVNFDEKFLEQVPDEAKILGCEPDWNAWEDDMNPPPDAGAYMRTAGGHVHVGGFESEDAFDDDHIDRCIVLAKLMDEELGVYSILWDKDDKRRAMYGQAGCFRPKTYGFEYRTLSNQWIFNEKIVKFVYEATQNVIKRFLAGDTEVNPAIREIINQSDRDHPFFQVDEKAKYVKGLA
jgi:hypothetical protein